MVHQANTISYGVDGLKEYSEDRKQEKGRSYI